MSSHHGSQKLRRNGSPSTNKSVSGPLRATLPISFMSQNLVHSEVAKPGVNTSNLNPVQIIQTKITPSTTSKSSHLPAYGRSGHSPWRIRQWSPTPKGNFFCDSQPLCQKIPISCFLFRQLSDYWLSNIGLPCDSTNSFSGCHLPEGPVA